MYRCNFDPTSKSFIIHTRIVSQIIQHRLSFTPYKGYIVMTGTTQSYRSRYIEHQRNWLHLILNSFYQWHQASMGPISGFAIHETDKCYAMHPTSHRMPHQFVQREHANLKIK
jgi:hypothetical protein